MNKPIKRKFNTHLLTWIALPIIGIWVVISYLSGITNKAHWANQIEAQNKPIAFQAAVPEEQLQNSIDPKKGLVTLWFDDAWETQYSQAGKILKSYKVPGVLAVPTQNIGYTAYMNWAQVRRLRHDGWEISSHSITHTCNLNDLDFEHMSQEIINSKAALLEHGITSNHYVAPCGNINDDMRTLVKEHYVALRGTEQGVNSIPLKDFYNIKAISLTPETPHEEVEAWLQLAKDQRAWVAFAFHQIEDSGDEYSSDPQQVVDILDAIKDFGLQVVTPSQVFNYSNSL